MNLIGTTMLALALLLAGCRGGLGEQCHDDLTCDTPQLSCQYRYANYVCWPRPDR